MKKFFVAVALVMGLGTTVAFAENLTSGVETVMAVNDFTPIEVKDLPAAVTVIAIGAGAMTVSHANDSYFWVVTNFGDMEVQDGYRAQTFGTFVTGLAAMLNVYIIYLFVR